MGLTLEWSNERDGEIPSEWMDKLRIILHKAGETEGIHKGEVALTFVDNERIQELNRTYRGIDKPTDVLSFAMQDESEEEQAIHFDDEWEGDIPGGELLGDIIISVPKAIEQSAEYGHSLLREIGFLFVHGFLHLLGYDHHDEESEKAMFAKQEYILNEVGLTR